MNRYTSAVIHHGTICHNSKPPRCFCTAALSRRHVLIDKSSKLVRAIERIRCPLRDRNHSGTGLPDLGNYKPLVDNVALQHVLLRSVYSKV